MGKWEGEVSNPIGRPPAFGSPELFDEAIESYFAKGGPAWTGGVFMPTMAGLALHLGVDRKTVTNYSHKDEFFPAIKRARGIVEDALEKRLYGNNVTGIIFNLKNNFGWSDKQEIDHTSTDGSMSPTRIELVAPSDDSKS